MSNITCEGSIGKIPPTVDVVLASSFSGLLLNMNYPSPCNGRVIAWNYCYYVNVQAVNQESTQITVQAGVWREQGMGYELLDESLTDLHIPQPDRSLQFVCREWYLDFDRTFQVQEGDIVGLYMKEESHKIHFSKIPASSEQLNATLKVEDITQLRSTIMNSQLSNTAYSFYLMAVIGM